MDTTTEPTTVEDVTSAPHRPLTLSRDQRDPKGAAGDRQVRLTRGAVEVRATASGAPLIVGYAAVFNQPTRIDDWFGSFLEKCGARCFDKTLADGADVRALFNHDVNFVLGRTKSGTLRLSTDDHGLHYEADPPDTQWARDLCETMRRGDVDGSSFGFRVLRDAWSMVLDPEGDGENDLTDCRTLQEVQLYDVSPVTFPAYPQTDSAVRAALGQAGFDLDSLARVVTRGYRGLTLSTRDRETVRAAVDYLRHFLPTDHQTALGAPVLSGHPPTNPPSPAPSPAPTERSHADRLLLARLDSLTKYV